MSIQPVLIPVSCLLHHKFCEQPSLLGCAELNTEGKVLTFKKEGIAVSAPLQFVKFVNRYFDSCSRKTLQIMSLFDNSKYLTQIESGNTSPNEPDIHIVLYIGQLIPVKNEQTH